MKKQKYTVITLITAVLFIIGSMAATNTILKYSETKLLTESGKMEVESPVRGWKAGNGNDGTMADGDDDRKEYALTVEQIEEAVINWNNRTKVTLHDRVEGQITMTEAIENGKKWLVEMEIDKEDKTPLSVNAELGLGGQKSDANRQRDAYFSFWTVTYSNRFMDAVLYLNAVTGNVWGAEIKLSEELSKKIPDNNLQTFLSLTGLQVSDEDLVASNEGEIMSKIAIKRSRLYVEEKTITILYEKNYDCFVYQLLAKQN